MEPTEAEIERSYGRPRVEPIQNGWLRSYFSVMGHLGLVFSYLWRVGGTAIIAIDTWESFRDPAFRKEWVPLWGSLLLLIGVWLIGYLIARLCGSWVRSVTGHRPWRDVA